MTLDTRYFILDENNDPAPTTLQEWAEWCWGDDQQAANPRRIVAQENVPVNADGESEQSYRVSTVFLGLDHRFGGDGPPILFETMIFGPDDTDERYTDRYCTYAEALAGHAKAVELAKRGLPDEDEIDF